MIVKRSLLATIVFGTEGQPLDPDLNAPLTEEEQELAETIEENANLIDTDIQALEDMENIANAMEEQVLQNEVNLASIQGEDVPAEGESISVTDQTEVVTEVGDVEQKEEVIAEGEAPVATLTQDSSVEEIREETDEVRQGLESMSVLLSNTGAFKQGGLMSIKNKSAKRHNIADVGIESIINSPIQAYKQACLNYTVGLCSVKETIVNFVKSLIDKLKEFFRNLDPFGKFLLHKAKSIRQKLDNLNVDPNVLNTLDKPYLMILDSGVTHQGTLELSMFQYETSQAYKALMGQYVGNLDGMIKEGIYNKIPECLNKCHKSKEFFNTLVSKGYITVDDSKKDVSIAIATSLNTVAVFSPSQASGFEVETKSLENIKKGTGTHYPIETYIDRGKAVLDEFIREGLSGINSLKKAIDVLEKEAKEQSKGENPSNAQVGYLKAHSKLVFTLIKAFKLNVKLYGELVNDIEKLNKTKSDTEGQQAPEAIQAQ